MAKRFWSMKDPMSALTHFIGFLAVIPCFIFLLVKAREEADLLLFVGFLVFGMSLIMLYSASTIYHMLRLSEEKTKLLRRIDHMMIFVLIAGTYTPICLIPLQEEGGWGLLAVIWGIALAGILLKIFWLSAPRWLSTFIYISMGWLAVWILIPLEKAVSWAGVAVLLAGGIAYTVGAVIYGLKKPNFTFKHFGFHEIFHVFVMIGSGFHIAFMFRFIL